MRYSDGGINYHNMLSYMYGVPPAFFKNFMPHYEEFLFNNVLKKQPVGDEMFKKKKEKVIEPASIYELLYGGQ